MNNSDTVSHQDVAEGLQLFAARMEECASLYLALVNKLPGDNDTLQAVRKLPGLHENMRKQLDSALQGTKSLEKNLASRSSLACRLVATKALQASATIRNGGLGVDPGPPLDSFADLLEAEVRRTPVL